jgi:hypothetical protein
MTRTRQAANKRSAGQEEDKNSTETPETTDDSSLPSSSTAPRTSNKRKKTKQPPLSSSSSSSSSSSPSLPFALPDPSSSLAVYACGFNISEGSAEVIVRTLHRAIAHYAAGLGLPYPEPPEGYGASRLLDDASSSTATAQLSFFNHVPDTEVILLPDTRITAIPVPNSPSSSSPPTLSSLAASNSISYRRGMGYYQLTRPEKVSDSKQIIVRCDAVAHTALMGGRAARFGPGIPPCGAKEKAVTVDPAALEKGWTVWVQSTSPNRQLEPGTTALFDVDPSQKWPIG